MVKIGILDTNSSANKGSIGRLEGMIKCLKDTIPGCKITVVHRYFDKDDSEFIRLKDNYSDVNFEKHFWFNEKKSFIITGVYFFINSLKFNIYNKMGSRTFGEYDAFVDLNFIEPEKLVDNFSIINFIGILFVLLSLNNILSVKRPIIICSATIGPYGQFLGILAQHFLNKVDLITFRERYSYDYMSKLGIYDPKQVLTGDLAFLMDPPEENEINDILEKLNIDKNDSFVGITPAAMINPNFTEETYIKLFSDLSNFIIEELNYKIIYLANTYQDVYLIERISKEVSQKDNIFSFPFEFNASETKGIINVCDIYICSRFHALVASTSLAIPSIGIVSYSHNKFHGILGEMMQLEDYLLDIDDNFNYEKFFFLIKSKVIEILDSRNDISENLKIREKIVKKQAGLNGKLVNEVILSTKLSRCNND